MREPRDRDIDGDAQAAQDESRAIDTGVLVAAGVILTLMLGAAVVGVLHLRGGFAGSSTSDAEAAERLIEPVTPTPVGPSSDTTQSSGVDPAAALDAMRARYQPGPHVEVVGLLPSGLMRLRQLASTGGRTIDNPWVVAGGELRAGAAPASAASSGPTLRLGAGESTRDRLTVIPGAPARVGLVAEGRGAHAVTGLLVRFVDYPGHFFVPATIDTELGALRVAGVEDTELQFGVDAPVLPSGLPLEPGKDLLTAIEVAAVDEHGNLSTWVRRDLRVLPLGTGDVEVTLSMTEATDLDLYVADPNGAVVYYGNRDVLSGGHLDLDANAGCGSNMGVNHEHVFWPRGRAPAGTYQARVANYSSCIDGRPVDYRVTVRNCGETAVFRGRFEGRGESRTCTDHPGADRDWCQQVVTFEVTPCGP